MELRKCEAFHVVRKKISFDSQYSSNLPAQATVTRPLCFRRVVTDLLQK